MLFLYLNIIWNISRSIFIVKFQFSLFGEIFIQNSCFYRFCALHQPCSAWYLVYSEAQLIRKVQLKKWNDRYVMRCVRFYYSKRNINVRSDIKLTIETVKLVCETVKLVCKSRIDDDFPTEFSCYTFPQVAVRFSLRPWDFHEQLNPHQGSCRDRRSRCKTVMLCKRFELFTLPSVFRCGRVSRIVQLDFSASLK